LETIRNTERKNSREGKNRKKRKENKWLICGKKTENGAWTERRQGVRDKTWFRRENRGESVK